MAKTIKFNLNLDKYPVRSIEGLQEHFSIEDILEYYNNGLLMRWLDVRGYTEYLEKVQNIDKNTNSISKVKELVKIFDIELDEEKIEESVCVLDYEEENISLNQIYKDNNFKKEQIIDDYHSGYYALIVKMEENKENMAILKATAIEMEKSYRYLFELDQYRLFFRLEETAPKAIFALLTRDIFRKCWLDEEENNRIYKRVVDLLEADLVKQILGEDLRIVHRDTQAMWDPIEKPETKIMVISIKTGTFIKNAGNFSEKLAAEDINGKLPILEGLEYQCNNETYELMYMEV